MNKKFSSLSYQSSSLLTLPQSLPYHHPVHPYHHNYAIYTTIKSLLLPLSTNHYPDTPTTITTTSPTTTTIIEYKWNTMDLTYNYQSYTSKLPTFTTRRAIETAFEVDTIV